MSLSRTKCRNYKKTTVGWVSPNTRPLATTAKIFSMPKRHLKSPMPQLTHWPTPSSPAGSAAWLFLKSSPQTSMSNLRQEAPHIPFIEVNGGSCYNQKEADLISKAISKAALFLKYGPSPASFRVIIAKHFTISITTDILTIKWACPRLVD